MFWVLVVQCQSALNKFLGFSQVAMMIGHDIAEGVPAIGTTGMHFGHFPQNTNGAVNVALFFHFHGLMIHKLAVLWRHAPRLRQSRQTAFAVSHLRQKIGGGYFA